MIQNFYKKIFDELKDILKETNYDSLEKICKYLILASKKK